MNSSKAKYKAIVIGASAGGLDALIQVLAAFRKDFPLPILVVLHISTDSDSFLIEYLNKQCEILVKEMIMIKGLKRD